MSFTAWMYVSLPSLLPALFMPLLLANSRDTAYL
jgi:hypothetical protein